MYARIYLGKEELTTNALNEKQRTVVYNDSYIFGLPQSVKRSEFYQAMQTGQSVELSLKVNKFEYYNFKLDAKRVFAKVENTINGVFEEYTVVREYVTENDNVELTLKRGVEIGNS